jgi:glycosyltransferase involved in cell wall biosynthesis
VKLIALIPVRNEALLLPTTIRCLAQFCDHILIADQGSTDGSANIAAAFEKVQVILNPAPPGTGFVLRRQILLDAFRDYEGENIALCLDADEFAPPAIFQRLKADAERFGRPGVSFAFWWVQLWRRLDQHRDDQSVWSNSWKPMAFWDDRKLAYANGSQVHEVRVPEAEVVKLHGFPILHLQWVYWERTQYKQAWYRMLEFRDAGFQHAEAINQKYSITLGEEVVGVSKTPPEWLAGLDLPASLWHPLPNWHYDEIKKMFVTFGIERFEALQIWHIEKLRDDFRSTVGREPNARNGHRARGWLKALLPRPVARALKRLRTSD